MEYEEENKHNDLSESYCQSVERVTGAKKDIAFDFQLPNDILEKRKKSWENLFDKYSEVVSDEIEVNVTLQSKKQKSQDLDEDCYLKCRIPVRKSPASVQYWIDTGNPPCKRFDSENQPSESGSSLSEEECSNLPYSPPKSKHQTDLRSKHQDNSSYSSVDTAVYILSNTNITKKADIMAIVEGAKYSDASLASTEKVFETIPSASKSNNVTNNNINSNNKTDDYLENESFWSKATITIQHLKNAPTKTQEQENDVENDAMYEKFLNVDQSNKNCEPDTIDRLRDTNVICDTESSNSSLIIEPSTKEPEALNIGSASTNASVDGLTSSQDSSLFRRHCRLKKLFCRSDSPVDLTPVDFYSSQNNYKDRLSNVKQSLHPALDPGECNIGDNLSSGKRNKFHTKKKKRVRPSKAIRENSVKNCAQSTDESSIQDESPKNNSNSRLPTSTHETLTKSQKILSEGQKAVESTTELDVTTEEMTEQMKLDENVIAKMSKGSNNNSNEAFVRDGEFVLSLKKPVVYLERLSESLIRWYKKSEDIQHYDLLENTKLANGILSHEEYTELQREMNESSSKSLHSLAKVQSLDLDTGDSDQSTILICECRRNSTSSSCTKEKRRSSKRFRETRHKSLHNEENQLGEQISDDSQKNRNLYLRDYINPVVLLERLNIPNSKIGYSASSEVMQSSDKSFVRSPEKSTRLTKDKRLSVHRNNSVKHNKSRLNNISKHILKDAVVVLERISFTKPDKKHPILSHSLERNLKFDEQQNQTENSFTLSNVFEEGNDTDKPLSSSSSYKKRLRNSAARIADLERGREKRQKTESFDLLLSDEEDGLTKLFRNLASDTNNTENTKMDDTSTVAAQDDQEGNLKNSKLRRVTYADYFLETDSESLSSQSTHFNRTLITRKVSKDRSKNQSILTHPMTRRQSVLPAIPRSKSLSFGRNYLKFKRRKKISRNRENDALHFETGMFQSDSESELSAYLSWETQNAEDELSKIQKGPKTADIKNVSFISLPIKASPVLRQRTLSTKLENSNKKILKVPSNLRKRPFQRRLRREASDILNSNLKFFTSDSESSRRKTRNRRRSSKTDASDTTIKGSPSPRRSTVVTRSTRKKLSDINNSVNNGTDIAAINVEHVAALNANAKKRTASLEKLNDFSKDLNGKEVSSGDLVFETRRCFDDSNSDDMV